MHLLYFINLFHKTYFTDLSRNMSLNITSSRIRNSVLDKSLSRGRGEVSLSCFALLFSEVVQYSQNRVYTVPELQTK